MDKAWGFLLAGAVGVFLGAQIIGAAIIFWPVTLVLVYWWIVRGK